MEELYCFRLGDGIDATIAHGEEIWTAEGGGLAKGGEGGS